MNITIDESKEELGQHAALDGQELIEDAISRNGYCTILLATGTSQIQTLKHLVKQSDVNWAKVVMFHLDEYIGLPNGHPASLKLFLEKHFYYKIPALKEAYFIEGADDIKEAGKECNRLGKIINQYRIDVAFIGIGENGHLAFNDPPADFDTEKPYIIVDLNKKCREQQVKEGWFKNIKEVPTKAISMSVKQIIESENIICSVPGKRKAKAVKACFDREITNLNPASILQKLKNCKIYLDVEASSLLSSKA